MLREEESRNSSAVGLLFYVSPVARILYSSTGTRTVASLAERNHQADEDDETLLPLLILPLRFPLLQPFSLHEASYLCYLSANISLAAIVRGRV